MSSAGVWLLPICSSFCHRSETPMSPPKAPLNLVQRQSGWLPATRRHRRATGWRAGD